MRNGIVPRTPPKLCGSPQNHRFAPRSPKKVQQKCNAVMRTSSLQDIRLTSSQVPAVPVPGKGYVFAIFTGLASLWESAFLFSLAHFDFGGARLLPQGQEEDRSGLCLKEDLAETWCEPIEIQSQARL